MTKWINEKGEIYNGKSVVADGRRWFSPSEAKLTELGYHKVVDEPTEAQIAEMQRQGRIDELKMLLQESDYKAIKFAEGWITAEDYAEVKAQRQAWREEINELLNV